jgi:hypothetical protein
LEAAHIFRHVVSGINKNENGILLRADLHRLFDCNLLLIHPETLTVHLDDSVSDEQYRIFDNAKIRLPVDGSRPSRTYLLQRWNEAKKMES